MRVVLLGMPGAGKGTQAVRLGAALGIPHISTGDILREAVREGSTLGREVQGSLEAGKLVSDELMGELIRERLGRLDAAGGFVLDGFPRTREQVRILDRILGDLGLELDAVALLAAGSAEIVRRLSGRRVCPRCSAVFHLESRPPAAPGVCDRCGSALAQREDDTPAVIDRRLAVFAAETAPLLEIYRSRGVLREIDAVGEPDAVFARLEREVGAR